MFMVAVTTLKEGFLGLGTLKCTPFTLSCSGVEIRGKIKVFDLPTGEGIMVENGRFRVCHCPVLLWRGAKVLGHPVYYM